MIRNLVIILETPKVLEENIGENIQDMRMNKENVNKISIDQINKANI